MRLALACVGLLLAAGSARADVFVPADPPDARGSDCAAAAGDVYAAGAGGVIRVWTGGVPPIEVPGNCPLVAAAPDGTAVVAGLSPIVRRPGGSFGAPIALGDGFGTPDAVAVAPGGWAVATVKEADEALVAFAVRPDGRVARTVVDRAELLGVADVGIDAAGRITVVWWRHEHRSSALRVARFAAGDATPATAELPGSAQSNVAAVAVAPGGSSLVAWASETGVRVIADGATAELVDAASDDAAALSASLADDGTALLAYIRENDELVTVERSAAAWQRPRVLWSGPDSLRRYSGDGDSGRQVLTTIAPGGRAAVVWSTAAEGESKVLAALGEGGAWAPATRLSSITRSAYPTSLAPDAAGVPRVLWSESGLGVRGATLAPARADVTAPAVAARFPARLPRTRDARVTIAVRVRCSEACDARFSIPAPNDADLYDIDELAGVARALEAGRTTSLRVRMRPDIAHELVRNPKARRLRLRLLVTDRSGNVVRRSAAVRVRVLEKPIRALKVAADHYFGMKTTAGNRMVAALVNDLIDAAAASPRGSEDRLRRRFARGRAAIRRAGHTEIRSSKVRQRIYDAIDVPVSRAGYDPSLVLSG